MTDKPRWVQVVDAKEIEALKIHGKYREHKPTWVRRGTELWALVNDQFKAWREHFGKRL